MAANWTGGRLVVAAILSVLLGVGAFFLDGPVGSLADGLPEPVVEASRFVGDWGDWPQLMGAAVVVVGLTFLSKSAGVRRVVLCMMLASTLAGVVANMSRLTTGRTRPNAQHVEQGWHGPVHDGEITIGKSKFNAFPSGHTATSVGFFGVLLFLRMPWPVLGAFLIPVIPLARLFERAHHFSDVVVGTVLALWVAGYCHARLFPAIVRKFAGRPGGAAGGDHSG